MSNYHDFAVRRGKVADAAEVVGHVLAEPFPALADELVALADRTRRGRFHVLLLGVFSTGKSTLLNALVGAPVLPAKVNPCTALPTSLEHAETPRATVILRDGSSESMDLASFVKRYQLDDVEGQGVDRFGDVVRATVGVPLPLLRDGVVLIDTPGLDDDERRTARTLAAIPQADAVIVVLNAARFLGDLERRILRYHVLPHGLVNLFFPVTMADLLPALATDEVRARADIVDRGRSVLGPLCTVDGADRFAERFFLLDARSALRARYDRDRDAPRAPIDDAALATSGVPAFEAALERFLVEERGAAQVRHVIGSLQRARAEVDLAASLDRASASATADELRKRQADLQPRFLELEAIARRVERTVDAFVARQEEAVVRELRGFLAVAEIEVPDAVARFDLGAMAAVDLLTERGRKRLEARLRDALDAWLAERLAKFQVAEGVRWKKAIESLREEVASDAARFDAEVADIVADFSGVLHPPRPDVGGPQVNATERWFAVAVGALLLSPGTIAAGYTEGYGGALKGAAGRIGARLAIVAFGALLGPVGWVGLLLYAVSDAVLLVVTGGGAVRRVREQVAEKMRGKLVGEVDARKDAIVEAVREALAPLKSAVIGAARSEADALRERIERTITERERTTLDAAARDAVWSRRLADVDAAMALVGE